MRIKPTVYQPTADLGKALLLYHLAKMEEDPLYAFEGMLTFLDVDFPYLSAAFYRDIPHIPLATKVLAMKAAFPNLTPGVTAGFLDVKKEQVYAQTNKRAGANAYHQRHTTRTEPVGD